MFVSRLDRPWIDTSFLLEGLLIKSSADIEQLRKHCTHVYVDVDQGVSPHPRFWIIQDRAITSISSQENIAEKVTKQVVANDTGKPVGAEALVCWESPNRGMVAPNLFMPVAESIGFINPLTIWMLNSALRLSADWTDKWGQLEVSVNIPPYFFSQPDFGDTVQSVLGLWEAQNSTLCLEILEQSFAGDVETSFNTLRELRDMGVKIAIDDFGTGYSCLSYFRDIPADELKIDKSFVDGLLKDRDNANIVELIIDLAHRFDLKVVAEGVEDAKTLVAMKKLNCDVVQGYYFSKPLPAHEFRDWLERFQGIRFTRSGSSV
jgi:EAL domain-containing protein (putative c-di-GMP-specific phosphodiesterase class I)